MRSTLIATAIVLAFTATTALAAEKAEKFAPTKDIEKTGKHNVDSYKDTKEYKGADPQTKDKVDMRMHPEKPGPRQPCTKDNC